MPSIMRSNAVSMRPPSKITLDSNASHQSDANRLSATEPPLQLDSSLEIWADRTSDNRTCHTAVSESHWRHFYLASGTKAQYETSLTRALEILLLSYLITSVTSSASTIRQNWLFIEAVYRLNPLCNMQVFRIIQPRHNHGWSAAVNK